MINFRKLKRFPSPLTLGNDICHIPRIARILNHSRDKATRFIRRVLTDEELRDPKLRKCIVDILRKQKQQQQPVPVPGKPGGDGGGGDGGIGGGGGGGGSQQASSGDEWKKMSSLRQAAIYMAGRWAAKEAVIKAHPTLRLTFHDIIICSSLSDLVAAGPRSSSSSPSSKEDNWWEAVESSSSTSLKQKPQHQHQQQTRIQIQTDKRNNPEEQQQVEEEDDDDDLFIDRNNGSGAPVAIIKGEAFATSFGDGDDRLPPAPAEAMISISHDGDYASAVCLGWRDEKERRKEMDKRLGEEKVWRHKGKARKAAERLRKEEEWIEMREEWIKTKEEEGEDGGELYNGFEPSSTFPPARTTGRARFREKQLRRELIKSEGGE